MITPNGMRYELGMTAHFIRLVEATYNVSITINVEDVHQQLKGFLTQLSDDIGAGTNVEATINSLGSP